MPVLGGSAGNQSGADVYRRVLARNDQGQSSTARRRDWQTHGRAPSFDFERQASVKQDGEVGWAGEDRRLHSVLLQERQEDVDVAGRMANRPNPRDHFGSFAFQSSG